MRAVVFVAQLLAMMCWVSVWTGILILFNVAKEYFRLQLLLSRINLNLMPRLCASM